MSQKVPMGQHLPASVVDENGVLVPHGDENHRAARVILIDTNGDPYEATPGGAAGGDGAINDGVDDSIKATVSDLADSNALHVAVVDANGDQVTGFGAGLTDTELRATPVDVLGPLTDTELRATPVDVSGPHPEPCRSSEIPLSAQARSCWAASSK